MKYLLLFTLLHFISCDLSDVKQGENAIGFNTDTPYIVVLGNVQDAGSPHAGCTKTCCKSLFENPDHTRLVTSLGIIDPVNKKQFLIEASPDLPRQMKYLKAHSNQKSEVPDGIFLTHGHIGHYTGLMYLGRESMNAKEVPVYTMPRMQSFLEKNGPWDQLINIKNIVINSIKADSMIHLTSNITITPFIVPHRDEYSETVGYYISGPNKNAIFIPDIDKWSKWDRLITKLINEVDYAFIDATFYDNKEVNNRDISEIPHPFVVESMELLDPLPKSEKSKVYFIHLNHTNPLLDPKSDEYKYVQSKGYNIATFLNQISL